MAAVIRNVILLSFVILQTALLEESFGREIPDSGCECETTKSWCEIHYVTRIVVRCKHITTRDKVRCAHQRLKDVTAHESFKELYFELHASNLGLFPQNFFENLPVTEIEFYKCNITEIPRSLIAPACGTLAKLGITNNDGIKSIGEKAFGQCPSLLDLDLYFNDIEDMSPRAFYGLSNLEDLSVYGNKLTSFVGLQGISKLSYLILSNNNIDHIDRNAFQNLSNLHIIKLDINQLRTLEEGVFDLLTNSQLDIYLGGNPLNCDCSLKWLQDWSSNRTSDLSWRSPPTCSPYPKPLSDIDLSHCPSTTTFQKQAFDRENSTLNRDGEWGCQIRNDLGHHYFPSDGVSRIGLYCTYSKDKFNLQCVQEYLQKVDTSDSNNVELRFTLLFSDKPGLFPENFLAPYPVTSLDLYQSDITQLPIGLISPVCDTLIRLVIHNSHKLKRIGEKVLANCSLLKDLDLKYNDIEHVSSGAFYGLTSLFRLNLRGNRLTGFNGLEGIPQLEELHLSDNVLKYIDKNAFQHLKKLRFIDLSYNAITTLKEGIFNPLRSTQVIVTFQGNHDLDCTNYTKWLQDSSKEHHDHVDVNCDSKEKMYRWDLNLTSGTPAKNYSKVDGATDQTSGNSVTGIADFVSFLIFMLFKIT